ncbi:MAG: hypothetical protein J2O49_07000, partial [Sciscionella sp.]|nr:hypothetical protein [Sciscionella sp.]
MTVEDPPPTSSAVDELRARYDAATRALDPPLAIIDLDAFDDNASALLRRAAGVPIRVASKSVRTRYLLQRALGRPGFAGLMTYSLAESIWLCRCGVSDDLLVAYPTADRSALRVLAADATAQRTITLMIDSPEHLEFLDDALG